MKNLMTIYSNDFDKLLPGTTDKPEDLYTKELQQKIMNALQHFQDRFEYDSVVASCLKKQITGRPKNDLKEKFECDIEHLLKKHGHESMIPVISLYLYGIIKEFESSYSSEKS